MPSCKQHTEKLTSKEIDCPFCEIQKCYIEINDLTEKLDEEIKIQHVISDDANKLEAELEKANDAYLGIKADYTSARQAWHRSYETEIATLRDRVEKMTVAECDARSLVNKREDELTTLRAKLAAAENDRDLARRGLMDAHPAEDGLGEDFDMFCDIGLLVETPADDEFKEEWGEDTMWAWAWTIDNAKGGA